MSELGSIFEHEDAARPRGADLRVRVEVPSRALGDPEGFVAPVPDVVDVDGRPIPRAVSDDERGRGVRLHLPAEVRPGTVLRLRGQGGAPPDGNSGGNPGDLYVELSVLPSPEQAWNAWWVLAVTGLASAGGWLAWVLLG